MVWPAIIAGAAALGGSLISSASNASANSDNLQYNRELAQNQIKWRVKDAKAAGIHPLAALGVPTSQPGAIAVGDNSLGQGVSQMGQDISRAVMRYQDRKTQAELIALEKQKAQAEVTGVELDNARKVRELEKTPPMPIASNDPFTQSGQQSPIQEQTIIEAVPDKVTASQNVGVAAGVKPLEEYSIDIDGNFVLGLTEQGSEKYENDKVGELKYYGQAVKRFLEQNGLYVGGKLGFRKQYTAYKNWVKDHKPRVPGIDPAHIDHNPWTNTFFIKPAYLKYYRYLLNKKFKH